MITWTTKPIQDGTTKHGVSATSHYFIVWQPSARPGPKKYLVYKDTGALPFAVAGSWDEGMALAEADAKAENGQG